MPLVTSILLVKVYTADTSQSGQLIARLQQNHGSGRTTSPALLSKCIHTVPSVAIQKDISTKAEEFTVLEAVTGQRLVKT